MSEVREREAPPLAVAPVPSPLRIKVVAAMTALSGIAAIVASLRPFAARVGQLNRLVNPLASSTQAFSVAIGIGLLYLAGNLARRKRVAWLVTTALFSVHLVVQIVRILGGMRNLQATPVQLAFTVLMLIVLVASRRDFRAKGDPPSLFQLVVFVPLYLAGVLAYGIAVLTLERNHVSPSPTLVGDVVAVLNATVGLDGPYTYDGLGLAVFFTDSLFVLGVVGLATALVLLFRPIVARARTHDDWDRANALVHAHGSDTLAYFALRHDKSYFFASDGQAFIAYAYLGRCALASGDPVGAPGSIDLVIDEFLAMCRDHGWGCAFLAVRQEEVHHYTRHGLRSLYLGDEAVIDCTEFKLEGKRNKSMRQSVHRVARTHRYELIAESDASPELVHQLNAISDRWRGKAPERGFTMSLSQDVTGTNPEYRLAVAYDENDRPRGFLRVVPVFGDEPGATLDLMRRDPDSVNGVTEYLVANTAFALRDEGLRRLSMNFAVMGRLFSDHLHVTRRDRVLRALISIVNPFFQIKSLHDFNRRFRPRWEPRVIVYEDQRSLPRVALLYVGVEGFLALPLVGRYFVPKRFEPAEPAPRVA